MITETKTTIYKSYTNHSINPWLRIPKCLVCFFGIRKKPILYIFCFILPIKRPKKRFHVPLSANQKLRASIRATGFRLGKVLQHKYLHSFIQNRPKNSIIKRGLVGLNVWNFFLALLVFKNQRRSIICLSVLFEPNIHHDYCRTNGVYQIMYKVVI